MSHDKDIPSKDEWIKILEESDVSRTSMNKLIMNYLVTEGFKEAAEKFQQESGVAPSVNLHSLDDRMKIRDAIMNGRIEEATTLINQLHAELLDNDRYLYFHLQQLHLIELIRNNRVEEALSFAQSHLSEAGEEDPSVLAELERTIALLAFEDPLNSPFGDLLSPSHRQKVASEVNAAILKMEHQENTAPKISTLLKLILWAQEKLTAKNIKYPKMIDLANAKLADTSVNKGACECEEEPTRSQLLEDHEAHVLVADWRLHKFQSPIELKHDETIDHDHFDPLEFHGHWEMRAGKATFKNTGKTAELRFHERKLPELVGGPLHGDSYIFEQLHFHWSDDDSSGCEHTFEGQAFSMEAHAVHYNSKYADFQEAHDKSDGLAVVGFFLEATDNEDNPCFNKMARAVQDIVEVNTVTNVPTDCLTWIIEEAQCKGYYTYQGSLTTHPYTESVTWILYPTPIHISRRQVDCFRSLKSCPVDPEKKILNNVRPLQSPPADKPLNVFYARSHRKESE